VKVERKHEKLFQNQNGESVNKSMYTLREMRLTLANPVIVRSRKAVKTSEGVRIVNKLIGMSGSVAWYVSQAQNPMVEATKRPSRP